MVRFLWDEKCLDLVKLLKDAEGQIQTLLIHTIKVRGQDPAQVEELLVLLEAVTKDMRHHLTAIRESHGHSSSADSA